MGRRGRISLGIVACAVLPTSILHSPFSVSPAPPLKVCAEPNNLPFSNDRREGFENRLADLVAKELGTRVQYEWWTQRRGFVRNTLDAGICDVVMGVPTSFERVLVTAPYYRSGYVFVTRASLTPAITSFDDPRLRRLRVGVQLVGDDGANSPPAHALARRGIVENVRGYMVFGDYAKPEPLAPIVRAVERREVDVAVVWGPVAGWYARRARTPLRITNVTPQIERPFLPFVYDIAVGLRRGDTALKARIDSALTRRRKDVRALLHQYGVPVVSATRRTR